jgi:hypothetical protein
MGCANAHQLAIDGPGYLRGAIDRLSFEATPPAANEAVAAAAANDFAAPVLQASDSPEDEP